MAAPCTSARPREGWEGLIVKEALAPYQSGRRSPAWRKLKVVNEQEFVVGGWTEPRQTRQYFGALLLGVQDATTPGKLKYVGHTGTGFDSKELARVSGSCSWRARRNSRRFQNASRPTSPPTG